MSLSFSFFMGSERGLGTQHLPCAEIADLLFDGNRAAHIKYVSCKKAAMILGALTILLPRGGSGAFTKATEAP